LTKKKAVAWAAPLRLFVCFAKKLVACTFLAAPAVGRDAAGQCPTTVPHSAEDMAAMPCKRLPKGHSGGAGAESSEKQ
jgi:hypothetical protein